MTMATKTYLDLFSPTTYQAFTESPKDVSGFRRRHETAAGRVHAGDHLLCYMTKLSRWFGLLEVLEGPYEDATPRFVAKDDPFVVRFKVKPLVWLTPELGVPIKDPEVWKRISFTREHDPKTSTWTGKFRTSLCPIDPADAQYIGGLLRRQQEKPRGYPFTDADRKQLVALHARRSDGQVLVTVPEDDHDEPAEPTTDLRESIKVQASLADLGAKMGMRIWLPPADRGRVLAVWHPQGDSLLQELPLNYDTTTLQTIENIDVIWMKQRAIVRAFEVEHTTAIYSGILRMADLLALQPNMDIRLHIVAPGTRRDRVFDQLRRPVFSLLDRRPLFKTCSFLSYEDLEELCALPHLQHLSDSIVDEYVELAEDA
jgi:hypothetical protein